MATLASVHGDMQFAARIAGAGQKILERIGAKREAVDDQHYHRWIDPVREALGDEAFNAAFAAGRALRYREAVAEARRWLAGNDPRMTWWRRRE